LRGGDRPDGAVEVAALHAFGPGGGAYTGQLADGAEKQNDGAEGDVGVVVNLLHIPDAGEGIDEDASQVEEGKVECGVPGEGVADAAIEGIGLVLVKADDVGAWLRAGQLAAKARDACAEEDGGEPGQIAPVKTTGKERKGEGAWGEEKDRDPNGPMAEAVDAGVALADLALVGKVKFSAILHWGEFLRAKGKPSMLGCRGAESALEDRVAGGAHLRGQHLQNHERQQRIGFHQGGELIAGDKGQLGAAVGGGRQRVGLVADESREAKERTGRCLSGKKRFAAEGIHGEGDLALVENVEASGGVALMKESAIFVTRDCGGLLFERQDQFRVGEKRRRVQLHLQPPGRENRGFSRTIAFWRLVAMVASMEAGVV